MGQNDLPRLLLMLLSSQWPKTQLLPDLHLLQHVFSKGTSVYCTKHDISLHWVAIALGDTKKELFFYRGLLFARFTLAHFIYLKAPWPSFHVYISFHFPFFLSLFFTISCFVPFFPNPQATFCIIKLYLSLRFTTFYRDASTDFFSKICSTW